MHIDDDGNLDPETMERIEAWRKNPYLPVPISSEELDVWVSTRPMATNQQYERARRQLQRVLSEVLKPTSFLSDLAADNPDRETLLARLEGLKPGQPAD